MSNSITQTDKKTSAEAARSKALVPKLRFKGFVGGWSKHQLNDIAEKVNSGKTPLGGNSVYVDHGILFIRSQNVLDSKLSYENSTFITKEINDTMKNSIVKSNDILLNITGASLGRSCVVPKEFTVGNVNQHVCIIRLTKENNPYFFQPIFASDKGQKLFTSLQTGSGREGLNFQSIKKITLAIPTLPEQQKIASFLSAVDEKIQQLSRKKELLEQYKKGVMQQLFSGKLRFKIKNKAGELVEPPKWEEKLLGDLIEIGSSKRVLQEDWKEEGVPFLRTREIINLSNGVEFRTPIFISEDLFGELKSKFGIPKSGDILATGVGTIGEVYIVKQSDRFYFKDGNVIWFKMNDSLDSNFINQLFKSRYIRKQLLDNASITTVATFTIDGARKTKIIYPCVEEQKKIADYLTNIDNKIEGVTKQITQTQTFKKGLLQQLFV